MKNYIKTCFAAVLMLASLTGFARAENLSEAEMRDRDSINYVVRVSTNLSQAVNLSYIGTSTEALVTITQTALTFYAPFNVADSGIGATGWNTGSYDLSASSTNSIGEVCDLINATTYYRCKLLGARRDDNASLLRDQTEVSGTNALGAAGGFDVFFDSGGVNAVTGTNFLSIGVTPNAGKRVKVLQCKSNTQGVSNQTFNISGVLRKYEGSNDGVTRDDSTIVYTSSAGVTNTDKTWDFTMPAALESGMEFGPTRQAGSSLVQAGIAGASMANAGTKSHVVIRTGSSGLNQVGIQGDGNFLECWIQER